MQAIAVVCFSLLLCSYAKASLWSGGSNATASDEVALIHFKSKLLDPTGSLASWNMSNHFCSWRGVTCSRRHPGKVIVLNVNSSCLSGRISPFLGNLSFLMILNIGNNKLFGEIPPELGHMGRLQELNLSMNSLQGSIPSVLGKCSKLVILGLKNNHLQGEIPVELGSLKNLVVLNLYANYLSGDFPPFLGNMSSLQHLNLGNNTFTGPIPTSLSHLSGLSILVLEYNNLSGAIPPAVWNISSLTHISVVGNALSGTIPPNALSNLPALQELLLSANRFHGHIPTSLANASNLQYFEIVKNNFSGLVPLEVGLLQSLQSINFAYNFLEAKETKDWKFMTALTNCSQLIYLELDYNRFRGMLPTSVSNLSTSLQYFTLSHNEISGIIPERIGNVAGLQVVALEYNYLTGTLPYSLSKLGNLVDLSLAENGLSGQIDLAIGNFTQLNYLYLEVNLFTGSIPSSLGNLSSLLEISLSSNNFSGMIPSSIFNIPSLSGYLDLSHNQLEGTIPPEVGNLKSVILFLAHSNRLSGEIPATLGECQLLQNLQLQNNFFESSIPLLLSRLKGLEIIDLSRNNLSGWIPMFFENLTALQYLNLSFNNLVGEVPTFGIFANATAVSVQGNAKLCGGIQSLQLPRCSSESSEKKHRFPVMPVILSLVGALLVLLLLIYFLFTWNKKRLANGPSALSLQGRPLFSYSQLLEATDGFATTNLLGTGTFGSVYRGKINGETGENFIAVKVLKLQTPGALKSFTAECEAMRNLRHRNLVKVITACSSIDFRGNDFKAIVFEFMPNGSLEDWLHPNSHDKRALINLNLRQRVSILLDVAYALDHLHFHGAIPIVHCDIKPSNVLLDANMVAHVGDFGLARIITEGCSSFKPSTSSMGFRGTIGYAPPEYGAGNTVSTHGDIYSYGILVLEMVTGRRPVDSSFEQGLSLRMYAEMAANTRVMDIVDAKLVMEFENELATSDGPSNRKMVDAVISLLKLGMSCSEETPSGRMSTKDIIKELHATKKALIQVEQESEDMPSAFC
ncbi:receptor kinase-like protein Xa21 [Phragmites australis]|uniref:receptor kinase-like protein Xa21 n=1 Tax=Phragmites australis TaxID=29695 RepID=UPI002D7869A6|nr:receptor kinase-like protein Xa21 [Phragmites australis]